MMRKRLWTAFSAALFVATVAIAPAEASNGGFEHAWGMDVIGGNAEMGFEFCIAAASCKIGTAAVWAASSSTHRASPSMGWERLRR